MESKETDIRNYRENREGDSLRKDGSGKGWQGDEGVRDKASSGAVRVMEHPGGSGEAAPAPSGDNSPASAEGGGRKVPFWSFPYGRGRFQPWRRRLWELESR